MEAIKMKLFISKSTDTGADTLLALGVAQLFALAGCEPAAITIKEYGPFYEVDLPDFEMQRSELRTLADFDVTAQLSYLKEYAVQVSALPDRSPQALQAWRQETGATPPDPMLNQYMALTKFQAHHVFDDVVSRWNGLTITQQRWHLDLVADFFSEPFLDVEHVDYAQHRWQSYAEAESISGSAEVTALQIVNPAQGKGINRAKTGTPTYTQMKSFWLIEFLKFVGLFYGSLVYQITDGSEDYAIYVPSFDSCSLAAFNTCIQETRELCWSTTPIKLDIRIAQFLAQFGQGVVVVAYYKHMRSYVVMAMYRLHLSRWKSLASAVEHLDEGKEDATLLRSAREALQSNQKRMEFAALYGASLVSHPDRSPLVMEFEVK
jgi:hypothetical protein